MGRLQFKDNDDEHNSYQSYTDLMSGFLIVFMIASAIALAVYTDIFGPGPGGGELPEFLREAIIQLSKAQSQIGNNEYIEYDSKHNMFKVRKHVDFKKNDPIIPEGNKNDLIQAGNSIQKILSGYKANNYVGFKIIIDGRIGEGENERIPGSQRNLSYNRALNLHRLWTENNILTEHNVIVAGSGLEGEGREPGRNRTFVIQIIPYVKTNLINKSK